jgi:hypothetical protein
MFTKIQEALDALKPGQVVEIIDKGPYEETLRLTKVPSDTGLLSRVATVIHSSSWTAKGQYASCHMLKFANAFRASGMAFDVSGQPNPDDFAFGSGRVAAGVEVSDSENLVIEGCLFRCNSSIDSPIRALHLQCSATDSGVASNIRDCVFIGTCGAITSKDRLLIQRCLFQDGYSLLSVVAGDRCESVRIENNVFAPTSTHAIQCQIWGERRVGVLIRNNTILASQSTSLCFSQVAGIASATIVNNIFARSIGFGETQELPPQDRQDWRVAGNYHSNKRESLKPFLDLDTAVGQELESMFLSLDAKDHSYLRIRTDLSQMEGQASGPPDGFIGALPPGPAPPEGDWFTRLRERWKVAITLRRDEPSTSPAVPGATSNNSSNSTPSGSSRRSVTATFEEPPPLDEWLQGREILTVKQDGSAMFTKIQDALDALKPGQVVQVRDRGPYDENLTIVAPGEFGLISDVNTIISPPEWLLESDGKLRGHKLYARSTFRVTGFAFLDVSQPLPRVLKGATLMQVIASRGGVLEDCAFRTTHVPSETHRRGAIDLRYSNDSSDHAGKPLFFRFSDVSGRLFIESNRDDAHVVIANNWIRDYPAALLDFAPRNRGTSIVLKNVFRCDVIGTAFSSAGDDPATFRFVANTIIARNGAIRVGGLSESQDVTIERNILVGQTRFASEALPQRFIAKEWTVVANLVWPISGNTEDTLLSAADKVANPEFISLDPKQRDYARIAIDSAAASNATKDGSFIGALAPGPAPPEGDWFTRLRERWQDVLAESSEPSDKSPEPKQP